MTALAHEVNFDGLVGPTHNYAGLAYGNLASQQNKGMVASPKQAALQGLRKMKLLADLGVKQAVLPPHERPDLQTLRRLGFRGTEAAVLAAAQRAAPAIMAACCSASAMWTANAATVSPSADTADHRVHFTAANLVSHFHRAIEASTTAAVLQRIFPDQSRFAHHSPLPRASALCDEGAANHMRLSTAHGEAGLELFVFGRLGLSGDTTDTREFPARQTMEASSAVARLHRLSPGHVVLIRQNPAAIDAGVFHNDVIATANQNVLLYHTAAFCESQKVIAEIQRQFQGLTREELCVIEVTEDEIPLSAAVGSYLFNSQLVTLPDGTMVLLAPAECQQYGSTRQWLGALVESKTPIRQVQFVDTRQSMKNGGGPACLRLRAVLTDEELLAMHPGVMLNRDLYEQLVGWVQKHYRDHVTPADLADPKLLEESRRALDELTGILRLGPIYSFQKAV